MRFGGQEVQRAQRGNREGCKPQGGYLKPALGVTSIIIARKQCEFAAVGALLKQNQLGVKGAIAQADVHGHCFQRSKGIDIVLHDIAHWHGSHIRYKWCDIIVPGVKMHFMER